MTDKNIGTQYVSCSYAIIKVIGLEASAIYGYIWSKQQLQLGYCCVSQPTIAKDLQLNRKTVIKYLKELRKYGLVKVVGKEGYKGSAHQTLRLVCNDNTLIQMDENKETLIMINKLIEYGYEPLEAESIKEYCKINLQHLDEIQKMNETSKSKISEEEILYVINPRCTENGTEVV